MPDDKASRELDLSDLDKAEQTVAIHDEAIAEEEFVADEEDTVNPMLFKEEAEEEKPVEPTEAEKMLNGGAIGSGNLEVVTPEKPFNNEEALRNENVNEEENKAPTTETDGAFVDPFASVEGTVEPATEPVAEPAAEPAVEEAAPAESVVADTPAAEPVAEPAPVAEPTPVASPINAAVPTDPATEQAAAQAAAAGTPKKKKTGLIIAIIVVLLLLIGGGVGFFIWYTIHESPENSVKDAISKLWDADDLQVKGDINTVSTKDGEKNESNVSLDVKSSGNNMGIGLGFDAGSEEFKLKFGADVVTTDDGKAYIKLKDIKSVTDAIFQLMSGFMGGVSDEDEADPETTMQMALMEDLFGALGESVSDVWLDLSSEEDNKEFKCIADKAKGLSSADFKKQIADLYEKNSFIEVPEDAKVEERDGLKFIEVKINTEKQKAFVKDVMALQAVKDFNTCSSSFQIKEDSDDADSLKDATVKLGIKGFSHELMKVEISAKNEKEKSESSAKLDLGYDKASIDVPSDVKTLKDVNETFKKNAREKIKTTAKEYVETMCKSHYTGAYVQTCIKAGTESVEEEMDEMLEDVDLESLFKSAGSMTGGLTSAGELNGINSYL